MLTEEQARQIVHRSINEAKGGKPEDAVTGANLQAAGVSEDKFSKFVTTVVSNPEVGVRRFEHRIDPNIIFEQGPEASIADLTERVLKLSAGKMCSNPSTPHPQECCPYPTTCPICGHSVR